MMPVKRASCLSKYLNTPTPPTKRKVSSTRPKSSGRVLTSAKSIELMEEKERKKQEKIREKEMRKRLREEKKKESATKPKTGQKPKGNLKDIYMAM